MRKRQLKTKILGGIGIIAIVGLLGGTTIAEHSSKHNYEVTITDKQVKKQDEKSDKYLIYTESKDGQTRVFEDTDTLIEGKFNSSDIYGKIKINKSYIIKTYGFRIPLISLYENIIDVEEVK